MSSSDSWSPHAVAIEYNVLYRFFAADGRLLYIGITQDLPARLRAHNKKRVDFREVAHIRLEHFDTREQALEAEVAAIRAEQPAWNKLHTEDVSDRMGSRKRYPRPPRAVQEPTHASAREAVELLGIKSRETVVRYVDHGLLRCTYTPGGHRRIEIASIHELRSTLAISDRVKREEALAALAKMNSYELDQIRTATLGR